MSKSLREQIESKCKHFTGLLDDKCAAGVVYDKVRKKGLRGIPCLKHSDNGGECEKCQWKTEEEIQARLDEINAHTEKFKATLPIIKKVKEQHKGEDWQGTEDCPVCEAPLHLRHAKINGHVWGKCETDNCVSFME